MNEIDIVIPELPESVADATIIKWYKKVGNMVTRDEVIVEIETDKIVLEIPATDNGYLTTIHFGEGEKVNAHQVIGSFRPTDLTGQKSDVEIVFESISSSIQSKKETKAEQNLSPAMRRRMAEDEQPIQLATQQNENQSIKAVSSVQTALSAKKMDKTNHHRSDKRIVMSRLRQRVAERLLMAKNETAMLTTFNEVNMQPIIELREKYGALFEQRHDIRLGFMSFYVKAVVEALKQFPEINASIDGEEIVYHSYFDISVAVSVERGLVTPVLRDANIQSMAEIEKKIKAFVRKGQENKLTVDELTGGTFTITNGGVFGSLMSTPIINPPQSAILGMHAIKERPMAVNGQVVILPMMYLALSYDHRLIDGREAIHFLVTIKEMLEEPARLLLDI